MSIYDRAREVLVSSVPSVSTHPLTVRTRHQTVPSVSDPTVTVRTFQKNRYRTVAYKTLAGSETVKNRIGEGIHREGEASKSPDFSKVPQEVSQLSLARVGNKESSEQYPYTSCGHSPYLSPLQTPPQNSLTRVSDSWDASRRPVLDRSIRDAIMTVIRSASLLW